MSAIIPQGIKFRSDAVEKINAIFYKKIRKILEIKNENPRKIFPVLMNILPRPDRPEIAPYISQG